MNSRIPDFYTLEDVLMRLDAAFSAAEMHGAACGVLVVNQDYPFTQWLKQVAREAAGDEENYDLLQALYTSTREHLNTESLDFALLLPDDDEPLDTQVAGLQKWCQGFAYGLALSGLKSLQELPDDSREWLQDVVRIGSSGEMDVANEEESETALLELTEFVRVGVLMMNEELQPVRGRPQLGALE